MVHDLHQPLARDSTLKCRTFAGFGAVHKEEIVTEWRDDFQFPDQNFFQRISENAYKRRDEDFEDWRLVLSGDSDTGFFGQLFLQPRKRQLVLVFKGTALKSKGDLAADYRNVFRGKGGLQVDSAFTFGEEARKLINGFRYKPQLFITGHSLGGFLAQVVTFTMKNFGICEDQKVTTLQTQSDFGLNTVVFDSPPALRQILRIARSAPRVLTGQSLNLPITNYVIDVNYINCSTSLGGHVGTVVALKRPEDIGTPSKWSRTVNVVKKHGLSNFRDADLDEASLMLHLFSADAIRFEPKCVPLLQFSLEEIEALHKIRFFELAFESRKAMLPEYKMLHSAVMLRDETDAQFIPALRFFISQNKDLLENCETALGNESSALLFQLWSKSSDGVEDLDLVLKEDLVQKFSIMPSGTRVHGLANVAEQKLFAKVLSNSISKLLYLKLADFLKLSKEAQDRLLRTFEGTLVLYDADNRSVEIRENFKTRLIYLNSESCSSGLNQSPLQFVDLDQASQVELGRRALPFLGSEVAAVKIFNEMLEDLTVSQIVGFSCEGNAEDRIEEFVFPQRIRSCGNNITFDAGSDYHIKPSRNKSSVSRISTLVYDERIREYSSVTEFSTAMASTNQETFILSCNPGMGKTTNLKGIAMSLQRNLPHFWIVRLSLFSCYQSLNKWKEAMTTVDQAIAFVEHEVFQRHNNESQLSLIKKIFSLKIKARKVIFVFDAFDEICPMYRKTTLELLLLLKEMHLKMLVATRPHEEREILDALGLNQRNVYELDILNENEQSSFLYHYWSLKTASVGELEQAMPKDYYHELASTLLASLYSNTDEFEIWGVPLNLKMVGDAFPNGKIEPSIDEHKDLYKMLTEKNIDEALRFKLNKDDQRPFNDFLPSKEKCYMLLEELAVCVILRGGISCRLTEEDLNFIKRFPLVTVEAAVVKFTHKTYAEYFTAQNLIRKLKGERDKIFINDVQAKEVFLRSEYKNVRNLLNRILSYACCRSVCVRTILSDETFCVCIKEGNLQIYQMLLSNTEFPSEVINRRIKCPVNEKRFHLELAITSYSKNKLFIEYLIAKGARLQDTIAALGAEQVLKKLMSDGCTQIVMDDWQHFRHLLNTDLQVGTFAGTPWTPLALAVFNVDRAFADFLISKGAVCKGFENVYFELARSSLEDSKRIEEVVDYLIELRAPVSGKGLTAAAFRGKLRCLEVFWRHVASIDLRNEKGETALMIASVKNEVQCLRFLLERGADPNAQNLKGRTALMYAVEWGPTDCLETLLEHGADPNARDSKGRTCLHYVVQYSSWSCFNILYDMVKVKDLNQLLLRAEKSGNDMVEFLMSLGADLEAVDEEGNTCLHMAVQSLSATDRIKVLLETIDVNARNKQGQTPLHMAARNWRTSAFTATLLRVPGVDVTAEDEKGWTALHHAASVLSSSCENLLEKIPIDSTTKDGETPLMLAAQCCYDDIDTSTNLDLLVKSGADLVLKDAQGMTCLHYAAQGGRLGNVQRFCDRVPLDCLNNNGKTALQLAQDNKHTDVVDFLKACVER